MFRVGSRITSFYEMRQVLEQGIIINVANAMGDRLGGNSDRGNNQERISKQISETLTGLEEEVWGGG